MMLRFPPRRRAREHPWGLTLAPAASGRPGLGWQHACRLYRSLQDSYGAVKAMAPRQRTWSPRLRYQQETALGLGTRRAEPRRVYAVPARGTVSA